MVDIRTYMKLLQGLVCTVLAKFGKYLQTIMKYGLVNIAYPLWRYYQLFIERAHNYLINLLQQCRLISKRGLTLAVLGLQRAANWSTVRRRVFAEHYLDVTVSSATRKFIGSGIAIGMGAMLVFGYTVGGHIAQSTVLDEWRGQIYNDYRRKNDLSRAEVSLLARKVGVMEARLLRLNVFGTRLAEVHELEDGEFDFFKEPGLGGTTLDEYEVSSQQLQRSLGLLDDKLDGTELRLAILTDLIDRSVLEQQMLPEGWPVSKGWVSSKFSYRISPFSGRREFHQGIDIAGRMGSKITAIASGVIKRSGHYRNYGYMVEIEHGNGYRTRYAHNQINLVQEGEVVKQGDTIALLGNTGRSTGPHLHFEVLKQGRKINPEKYLMHRH